MNQTTHEPLTFKDALCRSHPSPTASLSADPLTDLLGQRARTLLAQAVEAEVAAWIDDHAHITDEQGRRQVVRNGHARPRSVVTGIGPIEMIRPRVHDKRPDAGGREHFTSAILPPYLRKAKARAWPVSGSAG